MKRINFSGEAFWEDIVGYSRAVRIGNILEISGTTSVENGKVYGINDPYLQAKTILEKIKRILEQAGLTLDDVVRTRMFVTDISKWEQYAKAHQEYFGKIKPASSMIEVKSLIDPDMLIEIEATAIAE